MQRYANLSGHSGITAFELAADAIRVRFEDGSIYLYTYQSAGEHTIERMKALALSGRGLCGFISSHVHENYARKEGVKI